MSRVPSLSSPNILALAVTAAILYILTSVFYSKYNLNVAYYAGVYLSSVFIFPVFLYLMDTRGNCLSRYVKLNLALVGILSALWAYSLFSPFYQEHVKFGDDLLNLKAYGIAASYIGAVFIGLCFLIWAFFSDSAKKIKIHPKLTLGLCFIPLLLIDVHNNFDIEHYNAYLGPAIAVLHGKIPLVDVFCHYGLSYLVFTFALLIFPNTYAMMALFVNALNILTWILLLLMFRRMIKNPLYFAIFSILVLVGSHYILAHTINIMPSMLALRYLPTVLLAFILHRKIQQSIAGLDTVHFFKPTWFSVVALFNVFWSIEALVSLLVLTGSYFWIVALTWRSFFLKFGQCLLYCFSLILFSFILYGLLFHQWPEYDVYLNYVYVNLNPSMKFGARFLLNDNGFFGGFYFWIPLSIFHLVIFYLFLKHRFSHRVDSIDVQLIFFVNALAIVFLLYFVLQPSLYSFMVCGFPSLMLMCCVFSKIGYQSEKLNDRLLSSIFMVILCFFFWVTIVKQIMIVQRNQYRDADLLYAMVHPNTVSWGRFWHNLTQFCSDKPNSPGAGPHLSIVENTCQRTGYHQELKDTLNKWTKGQRQILLFQRDLIETLMEHHQSHQLLINPINDSIFKKLTMRILQTTRQKVHPDDIVIIEKNLNVLPVDYYVLQEINRVYDLQLLDETPHLRVFRVLAKKEGQSSDLRFPLVPVRVKMPFTYDPSFPGQEVQMGTQALFDHDKDSVWFVKNDVLANQDIFWVFMDFGESYWMDDIRIWRRIDFRKPIYAGVPAFHFLHHFNIEISEDNQHWQMIDSVQDFEIGNNPFYDIAFPPKKARYVRVNLYSNDLQEFSMSEIEVFGTSLDAADKPRHVAGGN